MSEEHPHHLLQQLPLTVSPLLSLPTAVPLPYSYKQFPSTLPPSVTDPVVPNASNPQAQMDPSQQQPQDSQPAQYVVSASGHSAHPDQIIASCRALQEHLQKLQDDARAVLKKWEGDIRDRELAEKRRVAPGWLDVEVGERGLVPERRDGGGVQRWGVAGGARGGIDAMKPTSSGAERMDVDGKVDEGEELDRAFGGLGIK